MRTAMILGLSAMALTGCSQKPKELSVDGGWVRLGAVQGRPAAAYFTIHGGPRAATLINVSTDVAIKAEMHESMSSGAAGGMTSMKPIAQVAIPAGTDVTFAPGGRHVMLFDVNAGIKPGARVTFTYTFADGTRIIGNSGVIAAGDGAPK